MKKLHLVRLVSLLGLSFLLIQSITLIGSWTSVDEATAERVMQERAGVSDRITEHAAGWGNPWINLRDGMDLTTNYTEAAGLEQDDCSGPLSGIWTVSPTPPTLLNYEETICTLVVGGQCQCSELGYSVPIAYLFTQNVCHEGNTLTGSFESSDGTFKSEFNGTVEPSGRDGILDDLIEFEYSGELIIPTDFPSSECTITDTVLIPGNGIVVDPQIVEGGWQWQQNILLECPGSPCQPSLFGTYTGSGQFRATIIKAGEPATVELMGAQMISSTRLGIDLTVSFPESELPEGPRMLKLTATINGQFVKKEIDITDLVGPGETVALQGLSNPKSFPEISIDLADPNDEGSQDDAIPRFEDDITLGALDDS